jgi:hypothetical protein
MDGLELSPLVLAETDALIAELKGRFPRGLLIAGAKDTPGDNSSETFFLDYYHGLTICIGLAARAQARLTAHALEGGEDAEEER